MFTGIIEEKGTISAIKKGMHSAVLSVEANYILEDIHVGDSIAVNGVCLTVTDYNKKGFQADVMHETLRRSSLCQANIGSKVNLERAMSAQGRFGGHIVSGHIDGIGQVQQMIPDDNAIWYVITAEQSLLHYIVEKGSVAIDGISLTVARVEQQSFAVSVIPHTAAQTILSEKKKGDFVNIETDVVGKYIERFLGQTAPRQKESTITAEFLSQHGF